MRSLLIVCLLVAVASPSPVAAAGPPDAVAVFIQGYASRSDADGFDAVKAELRREGWGDDQLVAFSYTGNGYWRDPSGAYAWYGSGYSCRDTQGGLEAADAMLGPLLRAIMTARPSARIVLVGHSFGGLLGWYHLGGVVNGAPLDLDGVVSIDSPLLGISSGRATMLDLLGCPLGTHQSIDDMIAMRGLWQSDPGVWTSVAARARVRGIGALSLGSDADCVYAAAVCGWPMMGDETAAQLVPGAGLLLRPGVRPDTIAASHGAVLRDPATVPAIVGAILGAAAPR